MNFMPFCFCTALVCSVNQINNAPFDFQPKKNTFLNSELPASKLPTAINELIATMVDVPAGKMFIGRTLDQGIMEDYMNTETRFVKIKDFKIGRYEVTQEQWEAVMGENPNKDEKCTKSCPVHNLSAQEVDVFILKLNIMTEHKYRFRLPTDDEWEYAARGSANNKKQTMYAGSDSINDVAWHFYNCNQTIHPVGQKKPNYLKLYDMTGNVCEYCLNSDASSSSKYLIKGGYINSNELTYYRLAHVSTPFSDDEPLPNTGFRLACDKVK